jgi:hypothetical protein
MKRLVLITLLGLSLLVQAACNAGESETAAITVENVRANMTLPTDTGSFWMEITNSSTSDDALVGASFDGCGVIELHDMVMEDGVMVMRPVEGGQIQIPAGETVSLAPGGLHVMCLQKESALELGTQVELELEFAKAGTMRVTGEVVEPAMGGGEMGTDN